MKPRTEMLRWFAGALVAALVLTALAPAAEAGRGRGHGRKVRAWEDYRAHRYVARPHRTVYVERSSSNVAPVLAGLIGGFVLGTAVSHAAPVVETSGYYYYDPYCEDRYASLDRYEAHLRYSGHPRVVRVIDVHSGACVRTCDWRDGGWGYNNDGWRRPWRGDDWDCDHDD